MSTLRLIIINLVVLLVLFVVAEIGLRMVWTAQRCMGDACDFSRLTSIKFQDFSERLETKFLGLTRFDPELGYAPAPGFDGVITAQGWNNARVSIDENGFRVSNDPPPTDMADILVAGDSFTFGDQVSNHETWAACVERKLGRKVDNAGVFGFGAAQAFKRATLELEKRPYNTLVLSILVGGDLERDQMNYRIGFPRPAVISTPEGVSFAPVSAPETPGTRYAPKPPRKALVFFYENSLIAATLMDRFVRVENMTGDRLQTLHPQAASLEEIARFVLASLAESAVAEKILLLQYREDLDRKQVREERDMLTRLAMEFPDLTVVDPYETLATYDVADIWNEHHNAQGNEVICEALVSGAFR